MMPRSLSSADDSSVTAVDSGLKQRWLRILPAVFVTYSLAYLDRANFGFGAAAGLARTLHITRERSALLGALFFLGYFLFQVPGAAYAQRTSIRKLIFGAQIAWGILAALTGVIRTFWLLALDRLLLGVAESLILPALLILLTDWFTRSEKSRANTLLILGNPITVLWMSAITGYLIKRIGWQNAFIIEGLPSVLWAFVWLRLVSDKPRDAPWMPPPETLALETQLTHEQVNLPAVARAGDALRSGNVLLLAAQFFFWSVGLYGFILWLPSIIRIGLAQGIGVTGLLNAAPYLLAVILMLLVSKSSDTTQRRKAYVWPFLLGAAGALFFSYVFAGRNFWLAYGFTILAGGGMYAPYGPFFAYIPETLPKYVAGQAMAFINSAGALGAFVGAWFIGVLQARSHDASASFLAMAGSFLISALLMSMAADKRRVPAPA